MKPLDEQFKDKLMQVRYEKELNKSIAAINRLGAGGSGTATGCAFVTTDGSIEVVMGMIPITSATG